MVNVRNVFNRRVRTCQAQLQSKHRLLEEWNSKSIESTYRHVVRCVAFHWVTLWCQRCYGPTAVSQHWVWESSDCYVNHCSYLGCSRDQEGKPTVLGHMLCCVQFWPQDMIQLNISVKYTNYSRIADIDSFSLV